MSTTTRPVVLWTSASGIGPAHAATRHTRTAVCGAQERPDVAPGARVQVEPGTPPEIAPRDLCARCLRMVGGVARIPAAA